MVSGSIISDDALLQELQAAEDLSFSRTSAPPTTASSTTTSSKVDSAEISALQELEKELGLEFLEGASTGPVLSSVAASGEGGQPTSTAAAAASSEPAIDLAALDLDENLEDFENFLKDLDEGKG